MAFYTETNSNYNNCCHCSNYLCAVKTFESSNEFFFPRYFNSLSFANLESKIDMVPERFLNNMLTQQINLNNIKTFKRLLSENLLKHMHANSNQPVLKDACVQTCSILVTDKKDAFIQTENELYIKIKRNSLWKRLKKRRICPLLLKKNICLGFYSHPKDKYNMDFSGFFDAKNALKCASTSVTKSNLPWVRHAYNFQGPYSVSVNRTEEYHCASFYQKSCDRPNQYAEVSYTEEKARDNVLHKPAKEKHSIFEVGRKEKSIFGCRNHLKPDNLLACDVFCFRSNSERIRYTAFLKKSVIPSYRTSQCISFPYFELNDCLSKLEIIIKNILKKSNIIIKSILCDFTFYDLYISNNFHIKPTKEFSKKCRRNKQFMKQDFRDLQVYIRNIFRYLKVIILSLLRMEKYDYIPDPLDLEERQIKLISF